MEGSGGSGCSRVDFKGPVHKSGWVPTWENGAVLTKPPRGGLVWVAHGRGLGFKLQVFHMASALLSQAVLLLAIRSPFDCP